VELLILVKLGIACITAVFGNAFSKWFLNTKAGAWFQKKLDSIMEFLQKRYDIEIAKKEVKWRRDYPLLAKRIDKLEAKIEGYEEWKKALNE
jgi:hypothetical protein|tara:strand:- start:332 stop:607 length:276 start_codon:yes stop_codon:yes gene_type:complete